MTKKFTKKFLKRVVLKSLAENKLMSLATSRKNTRPWRSGVFSLQIQKVMLKSAQGSLEI